MKRTKLTPLHTIISPLGIEYTLNQAEWEDYLGEQWWMLALDLTMRNLLPDPVTEYAVLLYARIEVGDNATRPAVLSTLPYRFGILHLSPQSAVRGKLYFRVATHEALRGLVLVVQDDPMNAAAPARLPLWVPPPDFNDFHQE